VRRIGIALLVLVALVATSLVPAAPVTMAQTEGGVPGGPFATNFQVQNLGDAPVEDCQLVVYGADENGDGEADVRFELPFVTSDNPIEVGGSTQVFTPIVENFPEGTFGGVVTCDQPVAAVVNFSNATTRDDRGDAYSAIDTPGTEISLPNALNNYFGSNTSYRIQNVTQESVDVTVDYFYAGSDPTQSGPAVATENYTLIPNQTITVEQANIAQLDENVPYAAQVTATGDVAVIGNIHGEAGTEEELKVYAHQGFPSGSTGTIYAPVILADYFQGFSTSTTIQNLGDEATTITMTYSDGSEAKVFSEGEFVPLSQIEIPANGAAVVLDFLDPDLLSPTNEAERIYGAEIQSNNGQPLIVLVNESTIPRPGESRTSRATSYEGFEQGSTSYVAPVCSRRYYGYNCSIDCQNLGDSNTTVSASFSGIVDTGDGQITDAPSGISSSVSIEPGATGQIYTDVIDSMPIGFNGSAVLTSSEPVACVVNISRNIDIPGTPWDNGATADSDWLQAYNAIATE